jgi:hypothetical protein
LFRRLAPNGALTQSPRPKCIATVGGMAEAILCPKPSINRNFRFDLPVSSEHMPNRSSRQWPAGFSAFKGKTSGTFFPLPAIPHRAFQAELRHRMGHPLRPIFPPASFFLPRGRENLAKAPHAVPQTVASNSAPISIQVSFRPAAPSRESLLGRNGQFVRTWRTIAA